MGLNILLLEQFILICNPLVLLTYWVNIGRCSVDLRLTAVSRGWDPSSVSCWHPDRHLTTDNNRSRTNTDQFRAYVRKADSQMSKSCALEHAPQSSEALCSVFHPSIVTYKRQTQRLRLWKWSEIGIHKNEGPQKAQHNLVLNVGWVWDDPAAFRWHCRKIQTELISELCRKIQTELISEAVLTTTTATAATGHATVSNVSFFSLALPFSHQLPFP